MADGQPGRPKKNNWNSEKLAEMELDQIFAEIPREFTVKVHRKEPEWAAGYLGQIHFDADEPFSVDELQARFGGSLFTLKIVDETHKYRGSRTVRIADVPRKNYEEMSPDFLTMDGASRRQSMRSGGNGSAPRNPQGFMGFQMPPGLPDEMQRKLMQWYIQGDEPEKKHDATADLMQQKLMMDMMQAQSNHQMAMQKYQIESERELEKLRRGREPHEPLGEVQQTIALLRELNGMKTEFGGSESVATEIIAQTAPILETALTEIIALQKLKAQSEIARSRPAQPRPLPSRRAPPLVTKTVQNTTQGGHGVSHPPINGTAKEQPNILELAKQMGKAFRGLSDEDQQECLEAFMGENAFDDDENDYEIDGSQVNGNNDSDTVKEETAHSNSNLLDPDDKAVLESGGDARSDTSDEARNIPDGEHTGTTETNPSSDRESDQARGGVPTD